MSSHDNPPLLSVEYDGISAKYRPISNFHYTNLLTGNYSEKELICNILNEYIKTDDIILDIGANIGLWSIPFAKKASSGVVYSIEPEKNAYKGLLNNIVLNKVDNIKPFQMAIANKQGNVDFYIREDLELHSIFKVNPLSQTANIDVVKVKTFSVDYLVKNKTISSPNFVKIDVEGAEVLVLNGMTKCLASSIREVLLEVHTSSLALQGFNKPKSTLKEILTKNGFTRFLELDEIHILASKI